ncbi:MAG TPA: alanine--glyoxylate aminotransferase family protein [Anaerolineales bacterium]|nr:alanine--glyoxylate aminotransferase family protein [Anaerolineales bacterium]
MNPLTTPQRILLGPGPSMVPRRVLDALAQPTVGHLDPLFQQIMDETKTFLRRAFRTENEFALPISGTGSAGMEAALCNFIEPGDRVLIGVMGYFGERMFDMATRYTDQVDRIDAPWGEPLDLSDIKRALASRSYKLFAFVHCETSTGVLQPGVAEISAAAHDHGALVVLDTVASWPGVPVETDIWDLDVVYSGSQKALSAPPGLAPLTVSPRAMDDLRKRETPVRNWYLDFRALDRYWRSGTRTYHHTAPVNMVYALREALALVEEEGLEQVHLRHRDAAEHLWEGLDSLGLPPRAPVEFRSPTLTTPIVPHGVDELAVRMRLLDEYGIEIAGGFGPLAGEIWRVGLMGHSARVENVDALLGALTEIDLKN